MTELILAGIIVITGVNWLYSQVCEKGSAATRTGQSQISGNQSPRSAGRGVGVPV